LATITNCVFVSNSGQSGGGMFNQESTPTVINCTFSGNNADTGGGIRNTSDAHTAITNCIVWGNSSGISNYNSSPVVNQTIVQGGHLGTGNLDVDPLFADVANGDLRPLPCSPAIDAGDNAANTRPEDFAGGTRIVGSLGTATIDIGAYEMQGDLTGQNTWMGSGDGLLWSDGDNWSDGFVPQPCRDVLIPTGFDVTVPMDHEALGKSLEVELGANLVTDPTATMSIGN
jgi:hypothetical protein